MYGVPGTPRSYVPSSLPSCPIFGNSSSRAIVCKIFSTTSRPDCGLSFAIHAASASISAIAVLLDDHSHTPKWRRRFRASAMRAYFKLIHPWLDTTEQDAVFWRQLLER